MNRFDFHNEWYNNELTRQEVLNEAVNIPVGILTAIFALYAFLLSGYNLDDGIKTVDCFLFLGLLSLSIIAWIGVLFNISKSYNNHFKGYEYGYMPFSVDLEDYFQILVVYVEENKSLLPEDTSTELLFEKLLLERLRSSIDINAQNNSKKSSHLFQAKRWLLACIIFLILSVIPFGINFIKFNKENKIQTFSISNVSEIIHKLDSINKKNSYGKTINTSKTNTSTSTSTTSIKDDKGRKRDTSTKK